jgi:hypothetical protein
MMKKYAIPGVGEGSRGFSEKKTSPAAQNDRLRRYFYDRL